MSRPILLHITRENTRKRYVIPIEYISNIVLLGEISVWPREINPPRTDQSANRSYVTIEVVADPEVLDMIVMPDRPLRNCATAILEYTEGNPTAAPKLCNPTVQPTITIWAPDQVEILGRRRKVA